MIYFGYPLGIHGWKSKPETEPDRFRGPELENRGWEILPESETVRPETRDIRPETVPLPSLIICCKRMFQVFNMFHMYVTSVLYRCCKSRSYVAYVAMAIHICCKRLFQMFYLFFSDVSCMCVYLDVVYVSHICCKCFIWILHMLAMAFKCFASISDICYMCFICFEYILQVFLWMLQSRLGARAVSARSLAARATFRRRKPHMGVLNVGTGRGVCKVQIG
jgi:hypothetical protein